jgi:DNA-binding transcriptional ArsR family regulator
MPAWRRAILLDTARVASYLTIRLYDEMVFDMTPARLDATFSALADPTRRAILARLAQGEASVLELAAPFAMSQPAISKHLKVLERAGLISRGRDAQRRPCRLEAAPLRDATAWLEHCRAIWEARLDALGDVLEDLKRQEQRARRAHKRKQEKP